MTLPRRTFLALCAAMLGLPALAAPTVEIVNKTPISFARRKPLPVVWVRESTPDDRGWVAQAFRSR